MYKYQISKRIGISSSWEEARQTETLSDIVVCHFGVSVACFYFFFFIFFC